MSDNKMNRMVGLAQMVEAIKGDKQDSIAKKLKKLTKKKLVETPLEPNERQLVERRINYDKATKQVTKWDAIVKERSRSKQLTFPLNEEPTSLSSPHDILGHLKPSTQLEVAVNKILNTSNDTLKDNKEFTLAEEKFLKAISLEEAKSRLLELQKMRALVSHYGSKMKRQKKIKSKSYHRRLKHEHKRIESKKVDTGENIMTEIEKLEKLRAKERATLKHSSAKQAKHARYHKSAKVRKITDQLQPSLTKPDAESDESSPDENSDTDEVDDIEGDDEKEFKDLTVDMNLDGVEDDNDDDDCDDEQRKLMMEAFADDDVIEEFHETKKEIEEEEQPKDQDLYLPGWNDWIGPGIEMNKKKRQRFIKKAKKIERRDESLGNVIISEKANGSIRQYLVKKLPHHCKSEDKFLKQVCEPVSGSFRDQLSLRDINKPKIVTRMGAKIEPMNLSELKNRSKVSIIR